MSVLFTFTKSIQDIVQLNTYLEANLASAFSYVSYLPGSNTVIISANPSSYGSSSALNTVLTNLLSNYSDPSAQSSGGIRTLETVYLDSLQSFSGGAITTNSEINMQGNTIENLSTPSSPDDAATKAYVDAIQAGSGLSKNTIGPVFNVNVDSSLQFDSENNVGISSAALGIGLTDAANKSYVNSTINSAAGSGLVGVGTVLSVNADHESLEIVENVLRIASTAVSYGLSGGSGTPISVNINQPNIVSVGTLTSLNVGGIVTVTSTADSTSSNSGSLQIQGGAAIGKSANVYGSLFVANGINANGNIITNVAEPQNALDAATKGYVDSITTTAGSGIKIIGTTVSANVDGVSLEITSDNKIRLSSTALGTGLSGGSGLPIAINSNKSEITTVGTLTTLTVGGQTVIESTTDVSGASSGSLIVYGGASVGKSLLVGSQLTVSGTSNFSSPVSISDTTDASQTSSGSLALNGRLSVGKSVQLSGTLYMNSGKITELVNPVNASDASNKSYVDSVIVTPGNGLTKTGTNMSANVDGSSLEITSSNVIRVGSAIAGTGLSGGSGVPLSVNSSQSQITSVGMLSSLSVNGTITPYSGVKVNGNTVSNVGTPVMNGDAANKSYVDSTRPTAGLGLISGVGTNINVNVDNFSLGISRTSSFQNTSDASSSSSGPFTISGGLSVAKTAFIGGTVNALSNLSVMGNSTFLGQSIFTGIITSLDTVDSVNSSTGSMVLAGGASVGKSLAVVGDIIFSNDIDLSTSSSSGWRMFTVTSLDSQDTGTQFSISNGTAGQSAYLSCVNIYDLGSVSSVNSEFLQITASTTGHSINAMQTGSGSLRSLTLNGSLSINPSGSSAITYTQDSSSTATGAFVVQGGMGVVKSLNVGGAVALTNTTQSTSPATGSLIISGGVGINGNINVLGNGTFANNVFVNSTTASTSSTTGALQVMGGVGIFGAAFILGNMTVSGH
ncbi:hypothetical protein BDK51DRAFT_50483 [Blyttiomyces helicus]|uniref:Uncharacterized protein n=1 Tax=Blyttiomyces helicus TaxID=388810 RepID=A0A4P9WS01_9FUNG|nr:hypothetical protein BDK51DRAFT_50483 [Blyttiomyces helicus]|eukprot:RKO93736.1 hypothetical protein BDK51DRAFT_50483 [Blyttiomyces helicus]